MQKRSGGVDADGAEIIDQPDDDQLGKVSA
jgi:hypothetical protein